MALGSNLMRFSMHVKAKGMVKSSGESSEMWWLNLMVGLCQVPSPGVTVECSGVNYSNSHRDQGVIVLLLAGTLQQPLRHFRWMAKKVDLYAA